MTLTYVFYASRINAIDSYLVVASCLFSYLLFDLRYYLELSFHSTYIQEAAIYDFQVDVLRITVSVCSHAFTNGLDAKSIHEVLRAFTDTYVETLVNYVGGDRELLYELTPGTATGRLKEFLTDLRDGKSGQGLVEKFTEMDENGDRSFIYDDKTRLVKVRPEIEQAIR